MKYKEPPPAAIITTIRKPECLFRCQVHQHWLLILQGQFLLYLRLFLDDSPPCIYILSTKLAGELYYSLFFVQRT